MTTAILSDFLALQMVRILIFWKGILTVKANDQVGILADKHFLHQNSLGQLGVQNSHRQLHNFHGVHTADNSGTYLTGLIIILVDVSNLENEHLSYLSVGGKDKVTLVGLVCKGPFINIP